MAKTSSESNKKREVLPRQERVQIIIAASQRIFSSRPYDEISIDDIAAEASMSKGLLYHYFASKRELYLETLRSVLATVSSMPENFPNARECLNALLAYFEEYPTLIRMVFRGGIGSDSEAEELLAAFHQRQFAHFLQQMSPDNADPLMELAMRGWISFFHEICLQWLEQQKVPREQVLDLLEQSLQDIRTRAQKRF